MNEDFHYEAEYVGGPVDGHVEDIAFPFSPFRGVRFPSGTAPHQAMFAAFMRLCGGGGRTTTRLAIYELDDDASQPRYRYVGTRVTISEAPRRGGFKTVVRRISDRFTVSRRAR